MSLICTRRRLVLRAASAAGLCALPLPAPAQDQNQTLAQRILELANRERRKAGLHPLAAERRLTRAAQNLAGAMIRSGQMSHSADGRTLGQRAARAGYQYRRLGENIAWITTSNPADLASRFVQMWMQSPPHRDNLMDGRFSQTGIAIARAGNDIAAAQLFGAPQ